MKVFFESFSNRELAAITWLGLVLVLVMLNKSQRKGLSNVVSLFFTKTIFSTFLIQTIFLSLCIYIAFLSGIWEKYLLKDSIWFIGGAIGLTLKYANSNRDNSSFKEVIKSSISLMIIIEFIANFHSFSYLFELILLPIMFLLGGIIAVTDNDKDKPVNEFASVVSGILGIWFLGHSVHLIYLSFGDFLSFQTLKLFLQPIILSLLYIPFIYGLLVYMKYGQLLAKMRAFSGFTSTEIRPIKIVLIKECGLNIDRLKKLSKTPSVFRSKSIDELNAAIREIPAS